MTLTILASSSEANCALIRTESTTIMVDCGLPRSRCMKALAEASVDPEGIDAIFLTHDHIDHIAGLEGFAGRLNVPIHCSHRTLDALRSRGCTLDVQRFGASTRSRVVVGDATVLPFDVPHDAAEPVGYRFEADARAICYATDLGWVPPDLSDRLLDCDLLAIESNYDYEMLAACPYPAAVKARIHGGAGHLENKATCELLSQISARPSKVVLLHLSEMANDADLAVLMAKRAVKGKGVDVVLGRNQIGVPL